MKKNQIEILYQMKISSEQQKLGAPVVLPGAQQVLGESVLDLGRSCLALPSSRFSCLA